MMDEMPEEWNEFSTWSWDRIVPVADGLLQRAVTFATLEGWLSDWSRLACLITESFTRLRIRTTTHTDDAEARSRFRSYSEDIMPKARTFEQDMKLKFLATGLEPPGFEIPLRKMHSDAAIFREENLALQTACERLEVEHQALMGALTVDQAGEKLTVAQVFSRLAEPGRGMRERAWRGLADRLSKDRQAIDRIWVDLLDLRLRMAHNAGFDDYRSFRWRELGRFDYTPDDCKSFQRAIRDVVVPAVGRMSERRRTRLSLDSLRVWDDFWFSRPDVGNRASLEPYRTVEQLASMLEGIFLRMDPSLGSYFRTLRDEELLDLDSRENKAQGGYMEIPGQQAGVYLRQRCGSAPRRGDALA